MSHQLLPGGEGQIVDHLTPVPPNPSQQLQITSQALGSIELAAAYQPRVLRQEAPCWKDKSPLACGVKPDDPGLQRWVHLSRSERMLATKKQLVRLLMNPPQKRQMRQQHTIRGNEFIDQLGLSQGASPEDPKDVKAPVIYSDLVT